MTQVSLVAGTGISFISFRDGRIGGLNKEKLRPLRDFLRSHTCPDSSGIHTHTKEKRLMKSENESESEGKKKKR